MRLADDSPGWLNNYATIDVDIDGLHSFAGTVDNEVEKGFQPHATPLLNSYAQGVPFGADSPSGDVHAAKQKYHDCLTGVTQQLTAYINASKILVAAVQQVARNYSGADALSEAQASDVENAFLGAIKSAQTAGQPGRPTGGSRRAI